MNQQPYNPEPPRVVMYPKEKYRGESVIEYEVMKAQVGFYKWGTAVFKIAIACFVIYVLVTIFACIISVSLYYVMSAFINNLINSVPTYPSPLP